MNVLPILANTALHAPIQLIRSPVLVLGATLVFFVNLILMSVCLLLSLPLAPQSLFATTLSDLSTGLFPSLSLSYSSFLLLLIGFDYAFFFFSSLSYILPSTLNFTSADVIRSSSPSSLPRFLLPVTGLFEFTVQLNYSILDNPDRFKLYFARSISGPLIPCLNQTFTIATQVCL
jgi:hypothetical protein